MFIQVLTITIKDDMKVKYVVCNDYWIKTDYSELIFIPKNLALNGDNVVFDTCVACSAIHDFLYGNKGKNIELQNIYGTKYVRDITRKEADETYKRLSNAPIPILRYIGLRLFGWYAWGKNQGVFIEQLSLDESTKHKCTNKRISAFIEETKPQESGLVPSTFQFYKI